jgi:H+-transporting ATPase
VYGIFVHPIGWTYALAVWVYALAWLPVSSLIAVTVRRLVGYRAPQQERHLGRVEVTLHS